MTTESNEMNVREKKPLEREEGTRRGPYFEPAVDIYETPTALYLEADIPGVGSNDISVDLRDGLLTISATVPQVDTRWRPIYGEYGVGHYWRQFHLDERVDQTKIVARARDGVLKVELPKAERMQPRRIEVKSIED